jgi:uncharacterized membrane protein YphA (DoxX/SURF4 family)
MKNLNWWNIILWILQLLLAFLFIQSGIMKLFNPADLPWPWIKENPNLAKATGIIDLLGGIGLVLPPLLRIQPKFAMYAAYGILLLMISASIFHISRGEGSQIGFNVVVLLIAAFIAWGRQKKSPFTSRN